MRIIDKFFLIVFLVFQVNFFNVIDLNSSFAKSYVSYSQKKILLALIIIYAFLRIVFVRNSRLPKRLFRFDSFIWSLILATIVIMLYTAFYFQQGLVGTVLNSYYFFIPILYFVVRRALVDWTDIRTIARYFGSISTIYAIITFAQSYLLSRFGIVFLHMTDNDFKTATQLKYMSLGFTRIASATDFIFFATLIFVIAKITNGPVFQRRFDAFVIIVNSLEILIVGQTRSYTVALLGLAIVYAVIYLYRRFGWAVSILVTGFAALPVVWLVITVIAKLLGDTTRSASVDIRSQAYSYFLQHVFYHKFWGIGFIRDDLFWGLIHGNLGLFNIDDVGIIGFLAQFGMLGIILLVILLISLTQACMYSYSISASLILSYGIIISFVSTSLFNPQRIFYLPIILALLGFLTVKRPMSSTFSLRGNHIQ